MLDITQFKAKDDPRAWLKRIIDVGGFLGACNGNYVVIDTTTKSKFYGFPKFEKFAPNSINLIDKLISIVKTPSNFKWQEMPSISNFTSKQCSDCNINGFTQKRDHVCRECNGEGAVTLESDYNTYEIECKNCGGDGYEFSGWQKCPNCHGTKKDYNFVPISLESQSNPAWSLNAAYAFKFSTLNSVQIAWRDDWGMYAVRFDGGAAVIMPMRA